MKLNYDVDFDNTPLALPVEIKIQGSKVVVEVGAVPDVGLSLSPSGGGMAAIIAAILDPAAEWFVDQNMGSLDEMLGGESYELTSVNKFEFNNMVMAAESLSTAGHTVEGKPILKIVPVLKITPASENVRAAKFDKVDKHGY